MTQIKRRGRPRLEEQQDLRLGLLRISTELLNEVGPAAISMREVARRVGCTHQAPYHYFPDKESILAALVEEGFRDLARGLAGANARFPAEGLRATAIASAQAYIGFALANPGVFRIMFRPDVCNPARFPGVQEAGQLARGELEALARLVSPDEGERAQYATILWSHVHGLSCLLLDTALSAQPGGPGHDPRHVDLVTARFADHLVGRQP